MSGDYGVNPYDCININQLLFNAHAHNAKVAQNQTKKIKTWDSFLWKSSKMIKERSKNVDGNNLSYLGNCHHKRNPLFNFGATYSEYSKYHRVKNGKDTDIKPYSQKDSH